MSHDTFSDTMGQAAEFATLALPVLERAWRENQKPKSRAKAKKKSKK
jgi:hypothetical protein